MNIGYTLLIGSLMLGPPVIFWLLRKNDAPTLSQTINDARR